LPVSALDEADTFYHSDLVGLDVVTQDGAQVGTVHALHNFGAGDILEIMPVGSGDPMLLPFTETNFPKIDLAGKQIVVVPPAEVSARPRASGDPGAACFFAKKLDSRVRGNERMIFRRGGGE
jgi:16S rRNA processing protein RimM